MLIVGNKRVHIAVKNIVVKCLLQEIDGKALLLMTRNDVLTGMSFKLGPALKIYAHVQRLQTRGIRLFH